MCWCTILYFYKFYIINLDKIITEVYKHIIWYKWNLFGWKKVKIEWTNVLDIKEDIKGVINWEWIGTVEEDIWNITIRWVVTERVEKEELFYKCLNEVEGSKMLLKQRREKEVIIHNNLWIF